MPKSKCGDICNFGYAVVSCIKAKILQELDNSSVYLNVYEEEEKCSIVTAKTPRVKANPTAAFLADNVESRRTHHRLTKWKMRRCGFESVAPP